MSRMWSVIANLSKSKIYFLKKFQTIDSYLFPTLYLRG